MTGIGTGRDGRKILRSRLRRVMAVAGLALVVTTGTGCQRVVDQFKAKQLIRKGNAYFKEQLYEDALKQYEEAAKLDPTEVRLKKFVAMANMATYNPGSQHEKDIKALETSIKYFKEYLAAKPEDEGAGERIQAHVRGLWLLYRGDRLGRVGVELRLVVLRGVVADAALRAEGAGFGAARHQLSFSWGASR